MDNALTVAQVPPLVAVRLSLGALYAMIYGLTEEAVKKVARVVRAYRPEIRKPGKGRQPFGPSGNVSLCVLEADLTNESGPVAAYFRYPSDPDDDEDESWTTDEDEEDAIQVWKWKIPPGKKIAANSEVWVVQLGGRWYPLEPESCFTSTV